jgi:hypothetical protein
MSDAAARLSTASNCVVWAAKVGQTWAARGVEKRVRKAELAALSSGSIVKLRQNMSMAVYSDCRDQIGKQIVAPPQRKLLENELLDPFFRQFFAKRARVWCNRPNFLN